MPTKKTTKTVTKTAVKKTATKKPASKKRVVPAKRSVLKATAKPKTAAQKAEDEAAEERRKRDGIQALRGMKDILPKEDQYWYAVTDHARDLAQFNGFGWIQTPLLEDVKLFVRSIGKGTDIVEKEMYVFDDRDGPKVALRPEGTAGVVRAYIQHGMLNLPQPVKVWYWGSMFRHERPQKGRYREHRQVGFEIFGDTKPGADAQLISIAYSLLSDLGVETEVRINSIGTPDDRARYIMELVGYYRSKRSYLCDDCKKRLTKNPLRLLDCKEDGCRPLREEAPQIVDWLSEDSKRFFMELLEYLDELEIPYALDPFLVRGLDYYTHTVFEFFTRELESETAQSALGGGGRYDLLVSQMGGRETPAVGFGLGLERIVTELKKRPEDFESKPPMIFLAHLGEGARRKTLTLLRQMRREGMRVGFNLAKASLKAQLEIADKQKVEYTLILGQKEMMDGTIIVRDMISGVQEIVDQKRIVGFLKKKM